jgi:hypothetical protein
MLSVDVLFVKIDRIFEQIRLIAMRSSSCCCCRCDRSIRCAPRRYSILSINTTSSKYFQGLEFLFSFLAFDFSKTQDHHPSRLSQLRNLSILRINRQIVMSY